MIDKYGFRVKLVVQSNTLKMYGSAEGHTCYIYERLEDNNSSNAVTGCEFKINGTSCDPRFAIAYKLSLYNKNVISATWKNEMIKSAIKRSHDENPSRRSIAAKAIEELLEGPKERAKDLHFKVWQDFITSMILIAKTKAHVNEIHGMLDFFYNRKLMWTTTMLDLWNMKMNEQSHQDGAVVIINCVLPFLFY